MPAEPGRRRAVPSADLPDTTTGVEAMTVRTMYVLSRKPGMTFEDDVVIDRTAE